MIVAAARTLVDLALPPRCPGCRVIVEADGRLCSACWPQLAFITAPHCTRCGLPFAFAADAQAWCGDCLAHPPAFDSARAAFHYGGVARRMVMDLKHRDRPQLGDLLAAHLARAGSAMLARPDALLVPVPLARWRLWRRGYNQAGVLARGLARRSRVHLELDLLARTRETPASRGMNRAQRAANVRGAFAVVQAARVAGRPVVLVDDVMTTGATANACARVLKRAGAREVHVLTLARVALDDADPHMAPL